MNKTFNITSGKICVTDPCYSKGTWCGNYDLPARNGKWEAGVVMSDEGRWGNRVAVLYAFHEDFENFFDIDNNIWKEMKNEVGVDSGQAGIFCSSIYPKRKDERGEYGDLNTFYGRACFATYDDKNKDKCWDIVDGKGVCSSSGYGDGGYSGFVQKDKSGDIVAVKIVFISKNKE